MQPYYLVSGWDSLSIYSWCHLNENHKIQRGFPGGSDEEPAYNAGNRGLIPGLGRFPGEGKDYPLQYSCLENPMDRRA